MSFKFSSSIESDVMKSLAVNAEPDSESTGSSNQFTVQQHPQQSADVLDISSSEFRSFSENGLTQQLQTLDEEDPTPARQSSCAFATVSDDYSPGGSTASRSHQSPGGSTGSRSHYAIPETVTPPHRNFTSVNAGLQSTSPTRANAPGSFRTRTTSPSSARTAPTLRKILSRLRVDPVSDDASPPTSSSMSPLIAVNFSNNSIADLDQEVDDRPLETRVLPSSAPVNSLADNDDPFVSRADGSPPAERGGVDSSNDSDQVSRPTSVETTERLLAKKVSFQVSDEEGVEGGVMSGEQGVTSVADAVESNDVDIEQQSSTVTCEDDPWVAVSNDGSGDSPTDSTLGLDSGSPTETTDTRRTRRSWFRQRGGQKAAEADECESPLKLDVV